MKICLLLSIFMLQISMQTELVNKCVYISDEDYIGDFSSSFHF